MEREQSEYDLIDLQELKEKLHVPIFTLDQILAHLEPAALSCLRIGTMLKYSSIPVGLPDLGRDDDTLCVATAVDLSEEDLNELKSLAGKKIIVAAVALKEDILNAIIQLENRGVQTGACGGPEVLESFSEDEFEFGEEEPNEVDLEKCAEETPIVRLVNLILIDGIRRNASHIHVEPYEKDFRVRLRIDGVLYEVMRPPMSLKNGIITRIKIMADLDIANRQTPQTGRIQLRLGRGVEKNMSVSTLPTSYGEKIVITFTDKKQNLLFLADLGLETEQFEPLREAMKKPGILLVSGPLNSGKKTTLQAIARELNTTTANIVAISGDDWTPPKPNSEMIGKRLNEMAQTLKSSGKLDLSRGSLNLGQGINNIRVCDRFDDRSMLLREALFNQDADIIIIDQLSDVESIKLAMQAGMQGKRIIAGITQQGDAADVVAAFASMGINRYLIASSVNMIVSQRLLHRLCPTCKKPATVEELSEILHALGYPEDGTIDLKNDVRLEGDGCRDCSETRFKGFVGIFELLRMSGEMREIISNGAVSDEIRTQMKKEKMMSLFGAGIRKVCGGYVLGKELLATDLVK